MEKLSEEERRSLIDLAMEAGRRAYAPYSKHQVGAALRTSSGRIFTGCNIENAAYPTGTCAERVAVFKAVSEGEREFDVMAVVTPNGGTPCGACRQVLSEFGLDTLILIANGRGEFVLEATVRELLPGAFTSENLIPDRE
jgi:cytidine deaminase